VTAKKNAGISNEIIEISLFRACLNFIAIIFIAIFEMDFLLFI
jgi:hypothetical protein